MNGIEKTFVFIPHTHWEGAVFKTREEYLEVGLPNILRALKLLKQYPGYRFTLDQVCYVKPFLERYPSEADSFRRFVREGRLAIVGGLDVMPDVNMPGGESFIRQVLYGKGYFRKHLAVDVAVAWQVDTFGHHAQMPQLLRLAGYTSFWAQRGVPDGRLPADLVWEGLDGTRIPFYWMPGSYALAYGSPRSLPEFSAFMKARYGQLAAHAAGSVRAGPAGADVSLPEEHVPPLVDGFNRRTDAPFRIRIGVPADYEAMAEVPIENRPIMKGDLNPIFQGTYSSRIELKQRTRQVEGLLTTAEKLGALLSTLGEPIDDDRLWRAWEPLLFSHAHDLMSGVMTDRVWDDTIGSLDHSRRIAEDEVDNRLRRLVSRIDTRGEGVPLAVFNAMGWARTDVVFASVGFVEPGIAALEIVDPDGVAVPAQIVEAERSADGSLIHARVAFVARDVPPLGFAVYRVLACRGASSSGAREAVSTAGNVMENEHHRLEIDLATGAMLSLRDRRTGRNVLSGAGNIVAMEADRGDLWELYHPLDAAQFVTAKERHPAPLAGAAVLSTSQTAEAGSVRAGPVFSEFSVVHPFGSEGRFRTTIRLFGGLRRIEVHTSILNREAHVRYRVLFPAAVHGGERVDEIPFGAVARPDGIECPAQNWIDYGNGEAGLALLNRGLPGNNVADGVMMLSLMRGACIGGYGFGGGYEAGMSSDSGLEIGRELAFDYALVPHAGDWRQAGIHQQGLEFNHPLVSVPAAPHPGDLPKRWGSLTASAPNIVLSSLRADSKGGAVLRVYEATGQPVRGARIEFAIPRVAAEEVNLMEDTIRALETDGRAVTFDLRPFEIKTIRLR